MWSYRRLAVEAALWKRREAYRRLRLGIAKRRGDDAAVRHYAAILAIATRRLQELAAAKVPIDAKGFDVSNIQNRRGGGAINHDGKVVSLGIDFKAARNAGYRFVWVKAGEGDLTDQFFTANVAAAKRAGLLVGGYEFVRPRTTRTGTQEARWFLDRLAAAGLGSGDLRPAADIEDDDGLPRQVVLDYAYAFMRVLSGRWPLIYTYPTFLAPPGAPIEGGIRLGSWGARFRRWKLWLADYNGPLDVPHPWTAQDVLARQTGSKGTVPGVVGLVDIDATADLRRLVA